MALPKQGGYQNHSRRRPLHPQASSAETCRVLSQEGGLHAVSPPLLCSDQERTEALLSSGVSLVLEMNCQFIFAEPGSESHSCVYESASGSLLSIGNR